MSSTIFVTKVSGEKHPFMEEKVRRSLIRSGATTDQVDYIVGEIKKQLYDGIPTRRIYKIAFSLLKNGSRTVAARYHLKDALMELGPSGFPFENYIARLLQHEGYRTLTGQVLQGKCVTHEIDIVAEKGGDQLLIECKYHNQRGVSCNIKIPLYIHARFNDVQANTGKNSAMLRRTGMIVTNTRFTADAVQYAGCSGIRLLGWDQPFHEGLKDHIDRLALYPVTCMTSLTQTEKEKLLAHDILLCIDLKNDPGQLQRIGITNNRAVIARNEVNSLCEHFVSDEQKATVK